MAKAENKSSTLDRILLNAALKLVAAAVGSERLAKEILTESMADGKLPWSCVLWKAPNAEVITFVEQVNSSLGKVRLPVASIAYHEGDPQFWRDGHPIDWEENEAHDSAQGGARALGIMVPRTRVLALLPEEARNRVEKLGQIQPADRMHPKKWFAEIRKKQPRQQNEDQTTYAGRLYALMQEANVTKRWSLRTLQRRLYDE